WVAGSPWNRWSDAHGMGGQMTVESAGENPEWIARQMGHTTTEMLFRVYSRYVPNLTRRDGSAFDNLIQANLKA
ncbi:hypothetical protein QOT38_04440, partial [Pseudomonas aeruginosa]